MTFTKEQMVAIVKMAKLMAAADGSISKKEVEAIFVILLQFGIVKDTLESVVIEKLADGMDASEAINLLSKMTNDQKRYVCGYLALIMIGDGDVDPKELALWSLVSTMAKFPEMTMKEAIDFIKNN
jgi:uncharacterized tellurite resistance protein B-like protein